MIRVQNGKKTKTYWANKFNGGEMNVQVDEEHIRGSKALVLYTRLKCSDDFLELAMTCDAIRRIAGWDVDLVLFTGYFPYGRQDRVCNPGEAFSVQVYANLLNTLNFYSVVVADPHSDVIQGVVDRCSILEQHDVIRNFGELNKYISKEGPLLVSPDAGANKKLQKLCKSYFRSSFIRADKARNMVTGEITETIVYCDDLEDRDVLIVDDICDGGYTFIKLAEALKAKGAGKVSLYVTHGLFSKGVEALLDNGIDHIYTTDSLQPIDFYDKVDNVTVGALY